MGDFKIVVTIQGRISMLLHNVWWNIFALFEYSKYYGKYSQLIIVERGFRV